MLKDLFHFNRQNIMITIAAEEYWLYNYRTKPRGTHDYDINERLVQEFHSRNKVRLVNIKITIFISLHD